MHIVRFPEAEVPHDLRSQVIALQEQAWPSDPPGATPPALSHDPLLRPQSFLLLDGPTVVAALDVLSKSIRHNAKTYSVSGLSTVVTDVNRRSKGFGHRLVTEARDAVAASGVDLGVFTCDPPLQRFYESAGWQTLQGTVLIGGTIDDPFPSDLLGKVTMGLFFSALAKSWEAEFVGSRIELFPGTIDRLW